MKKYYNKDRKGPAGQDNSNNASSRKILLTGSISLTNQWLTIT